MSEYVFVGGTADGERMNVDDQFRDYRVAVRPRSFLMPMGEVPLMERSVEVENYRKCRIDSSGGHTVSYFKEWGLSDHEALTMVFKRYPRRGKRQLVVDDILERSKSVGFELEELLVASDLLESHGFDRVAEVLRRVYSHAT